MYEEVNTKEGLDRQKRRSHRLRLITVSIAIAIIASTFAFFYYKTKARERYIAELEAQAQIEYRQHQIEEADRERQRELENQRTRMWLDSLRIANQPSYSLDDVREMVKAKAPSYSWIYLWRLNNDEWIMNYKREYGGKEHWFMRRFNPTTRKFQKEIEYSTVYYPRADSNRGVYTEIRNCRCKFTEDSRRGTLTYYEDGVLIGIFNRDGIQEICRIPSTTVSPIARQHIRQLENSAPDWADDGYESAEDYFYDNEEDLYFYY